MATVPEDALVLFDPQDITHYQQLADESDEIVRFIEGLQLHTREDAHRVDGGLKELKRIVKHVEMIRDAQVRPLRDQASAINAVWKPITDAVARVEVAAKRKLLAYQQAERERVAAEQRAARLAQEEAARRQAEALAKAERAKSTAARDKALAAASVATQALMDARVAEPMDAPSGFRSETGTTSIRNVWKFQVTDPALVPRDFLIVDEKAIRRAVAEGARSIAGVSIYEEEQLAVRVAG